MIVTQRATLENPADYSHFTENGPTQTLRFTAENPNDPSTPELWKTQPEEYAVGNGQESRSSSGGLTLQYTYKDDGSADTASCGGSIIVSGDDLGAKADDHGLQLNAIGLVWPANLPPTQSAIITLPVGADDATARGYAGGVAALQDCGGGGFPPVAGGGDFPPIAGGDAGGMPPIAGGPGTAGDQSNFPPITDQTAGGGTTTNGPLELTNIPDQRPAPKTNPVRSRSPSRIRVISRSIASASATIRQSAGCRSRSSSSAMSRHPGHARLPLRLGCSARIRLCSRINPRI